MKPVNIIVHLEKVELFQKVLATCIMCMPIVFSLSAVAAPGSATLQVRSPEISRSSPQGASNLNSAEQVDLAIQKAKIEALSKLGELEAKQAENRLTIATIILGIVALGGLGGGLAVPAIIKAQLIDDEKLKQIVGDQVRGALALQTKEYANQLNLFKAYIDIGLAFSDGETLDNSEIQWLLDTLATHLNEHPQGIGSRESSENMGKLADIACKADRPHSLSQISKIARKCNVSDPLLARRLMEHHGSELLRGASKEDNLDGFRDFASQCATAFDSELNRLSLAWQLIVYDNSHPAHFQEALAAAKEMQESSRKEIGLTIFEQSKSFRLTSIREVFGDALGKLWFFHYFDLTN